MFGTSVMMSKKKDLAGFNHIENGGGVYDCMKFLHNININNMKENCI